MSVENAQSCDSAAHGKVLTANSPRVILRRGSHAFAPFRRAPTTQNDRERRSASPHAPICDTPQPALPEGCETIASNLRRQEAPQVRNRRQESMGVSPPLGTTLALFPFRSRWGAFRGAGPHSRARAGYPSLRTICARSRSGRSSSSTGLPRVSRSTETNPDFLPRSPFRPTLCGASSGVRRTLGSHGDR